MAGIAAIGAVLAGDLPNAATPAPQMPAEDDMGKPKPLDDVDGEFDAETGTVHSSMKGRGIGDCWWVREWRFDGKGFVLSSEHGDGMCRGFPGGAQVIGHPGDPPGTAPTAEAIDQRLVQERRAKGEHQIGGRVVERPFEPARQVAHPHPLEDRRLGREIERGDAQPKPLERTTALGRVGIGTVIEIGEQQDAALVAHDVTSATEN